MPQLADAGEGRRQAAPILSRARARVVLVRQDAERLLMGPHGVQRPREADGFRAAQLALAMQPPSQR